MSGIRSIICFNGGSAGDFLKVACNQQLGTSVNYTISTQGMVEISHNFKNFADAVYNQKKSWESFDSVKFSIIENSHFYLEEFKSLTDNLFYIDYPDILGSTVVELYATKRFRDHNRLVESVKSTLPSPMQKYVNSSNVKEICEVRWKRNLQSWRENSNINAVNLVDFFNFERLSTVITSIIGQELLDFEKLRSLQNDWLRKNSTIRQILEKSVY
jgi:hypothetical protein